MSKSPYSDIPATFEHRISWNLDVPNSTLEVTTHVPNMVFKEIVDFKEEVVRNALIQLGWTPPKDAPQ